MQKYFYDVANKTLRTSSGADASINDAMQPNFTLGQKDILNVQLVSDDANTKYDGLTEGMTATFLADIDYQNPGIPLSTGNAGWVNSSGSEYYLSLATLPSSVAFDGTDATFGTIGSLSAGQWGYNATTLRLYVRLSDSTAPSSKSENFITVTYVNASATPLAIEATVDAFNLPNTWWTGTALRNPVITDGEITFSTSAKTPNFYNKLGSNERVTGFAEIQFFIAVGDDVAFRDKVKFDKVYFQNRLLSSGESPLELVGVDAYTKAETVALLKTAPTFEYSVDGSTLWHSTRTIADKFSHERRLSGEWSEAIPLMSITPKGAYVAETAYSASDYVTYNGSSWLSLINSNTGHTPAENSYWTLIASKGTDGTSATVEVGTVETVENGEAATVENSGTDSEVVLNFQIPKGADGADGTNFTVDEQGTFSGRSTYDTEAAGFSYLVIDSGNANDGKMFFKISATSGDWSTGYPWTGPAGKSINPRGEYSELATYAKSDLVSLNNSSYVSRTDDNIGNDPETDSTNWQVCAIAGTDGADGANGIGYVPRGAYSSGTTYALNESVTSGGELYASLQNSNTNHDPASSGTYWEKIVAKGADGAEGTSLSAVFPADVNYTLQLSDAGKIVNRVGLSANTVFIPANSVVAFPVGASIIIHGDINTSINIASITQHGDSEYYPFNAHNAFRMLAKTATNTWLIKDFSAMVNPMTTAGDMITGYAGGGFQRLAAGSEGKVLKIVSGAPSWADESGGGLTVEEVTIDTTIETGKLYIANSSSALNFTLPATFAQGFQFGIITKGSGGAVIKSGASEQICYGDYGNSVESDSSADALSGTIPQYKTSIFTATTANKIMIASTQNNVSELSVVALGTSGTQTINFSTSDKWSLTPASAVTLATSNATDLKKVQLKIINGGTNVSYPAAWVWDSAIPTLPTAGVTVLELESVTANGSDVVHARTLINYTEPLLLWMRGDGTNGSTTIIDSSVYARTITRYGNTQISTTDPKYGTGSILFDGDGDYLTIPNFISGPDADFTIEGWFKCPADGNYYAWDLGTLFLQIYNDTVYLYDDDGVSMTAASSIAANTWTHIAVTRFSGTTKLWIGGVLKGTSTAVSDLVANSFTVGAGYGGGNGFVTNIDNLKVWSVAKYTTNFTPEE